VRSLIVTVPLSTKKIRFALFPLTVTAAAPGPVRVRSPAMVGRADPRVIVPANPDWNVEVQSPLFTFPMPSAKVPSPELAELVTVKTCATAG